MRRLILAALLSLFPLLAQAQQDRPLRLVMNNELQVLDPIVASSFVTRGFAYFVWDTLIAMDSQGRFRPQMLESWTVSDDRLTYRFKLRPGLEFHDGAPVTAEDCVASLRRWAARDGLGRQMMAMAKGFSVIDRDNFMLELNQPFSQVIEALGKSASFVPFIMPARIAATAPGTAITEIIGSGPFIFDRANYRPGDRVGFLRNPRYRPRDEPADGVAGGKVVHVERAEMVSMPDFATRVAALRQGEIDYLERASLDFLDVLRRDRNVVLMRGLGLGESMGVLALNHTQPPFDNPAIRRAARMAIDQAEVMAGLGLADDMFRPQCLSIYMCGAPFSTDAGTESFRRPNTERARAMLREAGYTNAPVVFLHSADSAIIAPMSLVVSDQLRRAGFNVEFRSTDWSTVAQIRGRREGWNAYPLFWTGFELQNPLANFLAAFNCVDNTIGWYCDPARTPLLRQLALEGDPAKQRELATQIQLSVHENVSAILLGQFAGPGAHRAELRGVLDVGFPVLWNIRRAAR